MLTELEVRYAGAMMGHLVEAESAVWSFVYAPEWLGNAARGLTLSLRYPPQGRPITEGGLKSWFRNLLPEPDLRRQLSRRLGISAGNEFALLAAIAGDCPGAVSLNVPGDPAAGDAAHRTLSDEELRNLLAALPARPLLIEVEGVRYSLPGEHHKIPVSSADGQVALALGAAPATHILKPAKAELRDSVGNEAFCMALAAALGLPVAATEVRHGLTTNLLIQRVDRVSDREGSVRPLHMEDFCQLAGLPPEQKFEREGGVAIGDCADILRGYSITPASDLRAFVMWIAYGFLIGFGGGHGKQLALLHGTEGPQLAPFFGLYSTHVYSDLSERLAMNIGGEDRPDWLISARWRDAATELGVKPKYLLQVLRDMAERAPAVAARLAPDFQRQHGYAGIVREIRNVIERRARQTVVSLKAEQA